MLSGVEEEYNSFSTLFSPNVPRTIDYRYSTLYTEIECSKTSLFHWNECCSFLPRLQIVFISDSEKDRLVDFFISHGLNRVLFAFGVNRAPQRYLHACPSDNESSSKTQVRIVLLRLAFLRGSLRSPGHSH